MPREDIGRGEQSLRRDVFRASTADRAQGIRGRTEKNVWRAEETRHAGYDGAPTSRLNLMNTSNVRVLSAEERRFTCIHEAAHAAVHGVAGMGLVGVKVADQGAPSFEAEGPINLTLVSEWGMERFDGNPVMPSFMPWTEEDGYKGNRPAFAEYLAFMDAQVQSDPVFSVGITQLVRAHLCALLAGHVAESIARGTKVVAELGLDRDELGDMARVSGLLDLIAGPQEDRLEVLQHFQDQTGKLLCEPAIWSAVTRIADLLEARGELGNEDLVRLAPEWRPEWPAAFPAYGDVRETPIHP